MRAPVAIGRAERCQHVGADAHAREPIRIEVRRHGRMVMAQQELHLAGEQRALATLHAVGDEIERAERVEAQMPSDPARKERERERMGGRDGERCRMLFPR